MSPGLSLPGQFINFFESDIIVYYLSFHVLLIFLQEPGVIQLHVTVLKLVTFADDKA